MHRKNRFSVKGECRNKLPKRNLGYLFFLFILIALCIMLESPLLAQEQENKKFVINLKSRVISPQVGIESRTLSKLHSQITKEKVIPHVMIQFREIPSRIEKEFLKAKGIKLLTYVDGKTWYASLSDTIALFFTVPEVIAKDPILGTIRWIGEITPEDKIAPLIKENRIGDWARRTDGKVNLVITYFDDIDTSVVKARLQTLGAEILGGVPVMHSFTIAIEEQKIADVASEDAVVWIETVSPPAGPESQRVRAHNQVEQVQNSALNLNGNGVIVGVFEWEHILQSHADFSGRAIRKDATTYSAGHHPTMVAGIIGGNGSQSSSNGGTANQWIGMAPGTDLYSYNGTTGGSTAQDYLDFEGDLQTAIGTDKIDIANNSWGTLTGCTDFSYGVYQGLCLTLDAAVRGDFGKPVAIVFSAGNERAGYGDPANTNCITNITAPFENYSTMNYPKAAKNTIAVGAIDSEDDRITQYSSWGPLADGRIKPEIVASGHHDATHNSGISVASQSNWYGDPPNYTNGEGYRTPGYIDSYVYGWFGHTSCAAAATSGCLALLLEHYRNTLETDVDPLPSTLKALLIQSAMDLDDATNWYNPGPDYASGYGLLQIMDATDLVGSYLFREGKVTTNRSDHYTFTLPGGADSVKVTLVWDDPPAAPNAAAALVNDLDLQVYDPNNAQYHPWTLNPASPSDDAIWSEVDRINNVEQVFVDQNLTAGTWKVVVDPYALHEAPQRYSLVANYQLDGEIDVVQVLDRSGSMGGTATAGMADTKIQKLRDAASQFIEIMKPNIGNRLGIVLFNQNVVPFDPADLADLDVLGGIRATHLTDDVITEDKIFHGGSTSIGDGLREALNQFIAVSVEPERDRAILLVTDGKENTPESISTVQPDLIDQDITVHALGLGHGAGINESKLVNLAEATGGTYRITSDHLIFQKLFIETLAGAVDWSVINDPIGTITRDSVIKVPVVISPDQVGITFTVYWEGFDDAVNLELITPSGNVISNTAGYNYIHYGKHSRYIFYQLDFPLIGGLADEWAGEWKMKLTGTNQIDENVKVRYSTTAFAENGPKLNVILNKLSNLTGDEIQIKAYLTRDGLPLSGATIDVFGDVPLMGAGNVLHEGKVNWDQLQQTIVVNGDTLSMIDHKLQILSKEMGEEILQRGTANFRLYDDGLHGDESAYDGIYANKFTETKTQGSYTFRFVASGIPAGGGLQSTCEWTKSFYNEVNIDPDHSDIYFTQLGTTAAGVNYGLSITPRDNFGNYLGPGHNVMAKVTYPGTIQIQLTDSIDGTYSKEVVLTKSQIDAGVILEVYVDGKKFTSVEPPNGRWSASIHAGTAVPVGTFANDFDLGANMLIDVDYHFSPYLSLVGLFGYNDFRSKTTGVDDNYWLNLSANIRYYRPWRGSWSVYLGGGPGLYIPQVGDSELGANIGIGIDYDFSRLITFELGTDYHTIFNPDIQFMHNHGGIIFRF